MFAGAFEAVLDLAASYYERMSRMRAGGGLSQWEGSSIHTGDFAINLIMFIVASPFSAVKSSLI